MSSNPGFGSQNPFGGGIFGNSGFGGSGRGNDDEGGSNGGGRASSGESGGFRRPSALILTIIIIVALLAAFVFLAGVYADVMWFSQLGYQEVFWTERIARVAVFAAAFLVMGLMVWLSLFLAFKFRPEGVRQGNDSVAQYQRSLTSMRRLLMFGLPALMGVFAGTAAQANWDGVLLFFNQEPFGETDPQFGLDYGFYVFTLPFLNFIVGFLISALLVAGIAGILCHYLFGSIRIEQSGKFIVEKAARWHVAAIAALFLLLQGANWFLGRYATLQDQSGNWAGAMYTDVNAVIPAQTILAVAAVLVALIFIVTAITARWRLSLVGAAMLVITAIVGTGVYPFLVQEYQVGPTEQTLESEYIERNMELTRYAYGLDDMEQQDYQATPEAEQGALAGDEANIENIRLLDPNLVSAAYRQFQQFRPYYQFPDTLSFDRYDIDGETHDTVVAAREVNAPTEGSWVNQHLIYTHGYGLVAASANTVTDEGRPEFTLQGIPTTGELASDDDYEPRIYFGENSPEYSVVGAPEDAAPMELDRPAAQIVEDEDGEAVEGEGDDGQDTQYTFSGDGGPSVGNYFSRLVYALEFGSPEIFLSGDMNEESQILYNRHPRERVQEVAPYLEVDQNIYPAIVDGGVKWIIEGYTTSDSFPYSAQQQLESATQDAMTEGPALTGQVNYIRNSVKATVDAYDGSVELYAWDDEDPILEAWQNVFPSSLQSYEEMSADLLDHVRYPEDMFRVQRQLLTEYHVDSPGTFYEGNDAWSIPSDPTSGDDAVSQPPYYMTLQMPEQEDPSFQLTSTFIPATEADGQQRNVLYGFLAASGDAGTGEDGVKNEDYGQMRLLELPRDTAIPGPGQTQANFDSHSTVASQLNVLELGGSEVLRGNMISMPAGDGILNVQPVYVQATGTGAAYPALRMVLVAFGEEVGYGDTLQEALDMIFDGDAGVEAAEGAGVDAEAVDDDLEGVDPDAVEDEEAAVPDEDDDEEPAEDEETAEPEAIDGDTAELLEEAGQLMNESQEAMADGDWAAYGEAQAELEQLIEQLLELQEQEG